jgi:ABC-2 type transport system ATP-binding protein
MVAMVDVREVWKRYDTTQAVRGISLTVPRGSLLGLIGPNGAGKTSLLKMIATLSKPDRGAIQVLGRDVNRAVGPIRRRLGYMPAEFGRLPDMTVAEYLSYFGAAAGVPLAERVRRVDDVLELVDLVERRDSLVSAGSTGIKQRILIAKTLVHDPDLLVLDEPAAGLDPRARVEIREILVELNRLGKTIIVSSHILADLEEICDRVAIIEHGQLVAHGTIAELTDELRGRSPDAHGWRVRVPPADLERAYELLLALPALSGVARDDDSIRFQGEGPHANAVLQALIQADLALLAFSQEGPRLEDVFMTQTEGTIL